MIDTVKIWNRTDEPPDQSMERDMFSKRLFPSWIMVAQQPYSGDSGGGSLMSALDHSVARMKLTKDSKVTIWRVPENVAARYVRLQLEGFSFLHFAQIEVFGTFGINKSVGKCGFVCAGKHVTAAVVRPMADQRDVERAFKRATLADAENADVLRQLETFALEYDKYGRGERLTTCIICKGGQLCEVARKRANRRASERASADEGERERTRAQASERATERCEWASNRAPRLFDDAPSKCLSTPPP